MKFNTVVHDYTSTIGGCRGIYRKSSIKPPVSNKPPFSEEEVNKLTPLCYQKDENTSLFFSGNLMWITDS